MMRVESDKIKEHDRIISSENSSLFSINNHIFQKIKPISSGNNLMNPDHTPHNQLTSFNINAKSLH